MSGSKAEVGAPEDRTGAARRRRVLLACGLLAAVTLVGCASTVIDARKAREAVRDDVERKTGVEVKSVSCPTDVEVFPNETFSCRVIAEDGRLAEVELRIRNFEADVEIVSIEAAPG